MTRNHSQEAIQSNAAGWGDAVKFAFKLGLIFVLIWIIANMSDKPFPR